MWVMIMIYLSLFLISLLIFYLGNLGYFGVVFKKYIKSNNLLELVLLLFFIYSINIYIYYSILNILSYDFSINTLNMASNQSVPVGNPNGQDPVRWWPTGIAQTWAVLGGAALTYRSIPGNPRIKAIAALGSLGVSIPSIVLNQAIENPKEFQRLMYSWVEYKKTGTWPATIPENSYPIEEAIQNTALEASKSINSNNFISNGSDLLERIYNAVYENVIIPFINLLKPVEVSGYLDDLIGQHIFILLILFITIISLIILFTIFVFINILLHNKEIFINRFDNKFLKFYIKYQVILGKISLILLPILIFWGLFTILMGLYFLLTHPIPYEMLGVDLHTFIGKK